MKRAFKYRLYPNKVQTEELFSQFNFCRFLYNSALQERKSYYKYYDKNLSYKVQAGELLEVKDIFEIKNIYSQVLQQTLKQVDVAFTNFFRRVKQKVKTVGYPRFKNRKSFNSICFPQVDPKLKSLHGVKLTGNKLTVFGITGEIKVKLHRPFEGNVKQVRIAKDNLDHFYLVLSCDNIDKKVLPKTTKEVGIDLGIKDFAVFSDKSLPLSFPKPYKTSKEKLAYQQRKLANKRKGSNNYNKQVKLIAKNHKHIANVRNDWQHKAANHIVKTYDKIVVENLNIENMLTEKSYVDKSNIADASWGEFIFKLTYKAESADKLLVKVNPKNTSKMCSSCGNINKDLTLEDRIYNCKSCGLSIDRDYNASKNIEELGKSFKIIS